MPTVQTIVSFPAIEIENVHEDKFQACLGELIKENSAQLFEYFNDNNTSFYYPLVQYKVLGKTPILLAYNEAAEWLDELLKKEKEIFFEGKLYPISEKNIQQAKLSVNPTGEMIRYEFKSPWLALNQKNFSAYKNMTEPDRKLLLNTNLQNHILSCLKGLNYYATEKIIANATLIEQRVELNGKKMLGFVGEFETNARLPLYIGLGKLVNQGFGVVLRK